MIIRRVFAARNEYRPDDDQGQVLVTYDDVSGECYCAYRPAPYDVWTRPLTEVERSDDPTPELGERVYTDAGRTYIGDPPPVVVPGRTAYSDLPPAT